MFIACGKIIVSTFRGSMSWEQFSFAIENWQIDVEIWYKENQSKWPLNYSAKRPQQKKLRSGNNFIHFRKRNYHLRASRVHVINLLLKISSQKKRARDHFGWFRVVEASIWHHHPKSKKKKVTSRLLNWSPQLMVCGRGGGWCEIFPFCSFLLRGGLISVTNCEAREKLMGLIEIFRWVAGFFIRF